MTYERGAFGLSREKGGGQGVDWRESDRATGWDGLSDGAVGGARPALGHTVYRVTVAPRDRRGR